MALDLAGDVGVGSFFLLCWGSAASSVRLKPEQLLANECSAAECWVEEPSQEACFQQSRVLQAVQEEAMIDFDV